MASAARRRASTGGDNPEFVARDFQGMSNNAAREAIGDEEFYWMENVIPLAEGNIAVLPEAGAVCTISSETGPQFSISFCVNQTNYVFVVGQSGRAYVVNLATAAVTAIPSVTFSAPIAAVPYNNQGLLIVDTSGYYDWNVTTPSTLTNWNNSLTGGTPSLANTFPGGSTITNTGLIPGSGGSIANYYEMTSCTISSGGTGYVVGDTLTLPAVNAGSQGISGPQFYAAITVTSISAGGVIATITISNPGSYQGPGTGGSVAVPVTNTFTGGTGSGATFTNTFGLIANSTYVLSPGSGYTAGTTTDDKNGATNVTVTTITTSGIISGQAIAVFAGRVWIAYGRSLAGTNVDSYNNFGGAGFTATINDSYLVGVITALCTANNYLYLFGISSIDAISNVTVTSGITSFSRINITTSVGTNQSASVYGYLRAVNFFHSTGFYLLAGASPEKISDKISGVLRKVYRAIPQAVAGCVVSVLNELCAAFSCIITDNFSPIGGSRSLIFLYFKNKWFAVSISGITNVTNPYIVSAPAGGGLFTENDAPVMYAWGGTASQLVLYQCFSQTTLSSWILRTKLWDANQPLREKQSLETALGGFVGALTATGVTYTVDNELNQANAVTFPVIPANEEPTSTTGYGMLESGLANNGGGRYLGLTLQGDGTDLSQVDIIALRGLVERDTVQ